MDPVQLGIVFLAATEFDFVCPPAGTNLCLAASRSERPLGEVEASVAGAVHAIFASAVLIAPVLSLSTALPAALVGR